MRLKKYIAISVPVLNLTGRPDAHGDILPPECCVTFKNPVPIVYSFDYQKVIGKAYLMRVKDSIVADLHMMSGIEDEEEAKALIQSMFPSVGARKTKANQTCILGLDITAISVSYDKNVDQFITELGNKVIRVRKPIT